MPRTPVDPVREAQRQASFRRTIDESIRARDKLVERAKAAIDVIGGGSVYGTSVILTVKEAERLAAKLTDR